MEGLSREEGPKSPSLLCARPSFSRYFLLTSCVEKVLRRQLSFK